MVNEITMQIMANLTGMSRGAAVTAGTDPAYGSAGSPPPGAAKVRRVPGRTDLFDLTAEEEETLLGLARIEKAASYAGKTGGDVKAGSGYKRAAGTGGFRLTLDQLADSI